MTMPAFGVPSLATLKIYEHLRDLPKNVTTVTDDQLTEISGCDCTKEPAAKGLLPVGGLKPGRQYVRAAIKRLLRLDGVWWDREHAASCIKRLNRDASRATVSVTARQRRVVRFARGTVNRIKSIDKTALKPDEAKMFTIQAQQGAAMVAIGSGRTTKKLAARVDTGRTLAEEPDMRKLLEAMDLPGNDKKAKADDKGDGE